MAKSFLITKYVWVTLIALVLWQGSCSADCIKPIYPGENLWKIVARIGECLDESTETIISKLDTIDCAVQACEHPLFQTDMPYTITAPGTYCLAESVTNTGLNDFLITVSANNVILDLGGHVMDGGTQDGLAQGAQDGILVYPGMRNIIIQNGTIANFAAHGINASASTNTLIQAPIEALTIKDITLIDMSEYLPALSNTDQLDLVGSALDSLSAVPGFDPVLECCLGNEFDRVRQAVGIFVDGANDVMIDNCQAFNIQGDGIYLRYVQEGIVKNCQSERNGGNGFVFDNCDVTCVQSCAAEQNGFNGFYEVACAGDNSYADCTAKQNGVHGFRVIGSGKTIERCIANQNTLDGFYVVSAQNSTVDGSLDITFGGDGKTLIDFGGTDSAQAVAIQQDGKIVSAGFTNSGGPQSFALARQNTDGSLDSSFGVGGLVIITIPGTTASQLSGVAIQDDGKIVAAGFVTAAGISQFAVIRLHSDGSLDLSFNGTGQAYLNFGGSDDVAQALVLQEDGMIVVAGYTNSSVVYKFAIARFTSTGTLDFSTTTTFGTSARAYAVGLQKNGKIVLGGFGVIGSQQFALARYNTDGTPDMSFGVNGQVTTSFGNAGDQIHGLAIQKDGTIVAAGYTQIGSVFDLAIARYNLDGSLDSSFGVNGKVTTDIANNDFGQATVLQKDGKIIVVGTSDNTSTIVNFEVARYTTTGILDSTFGNNGFVTTDFPGIDTAAAAVLQQDGKLVAAGTNTAFGNTNFALARYNIFKRSSIIQDSVALENGRDGFNITDADKMTLLRNVASGNGCSGFIASAPYVSNLDIIAKNVGSNNFCTNYSTIDAALVTVAGAWQNITLN